MFRMYEKPDGWSSGQPELFVSRGVIKRLGMPIVDYDQLSDIVLRVTEGFVPTIKLHEIPSTFQALGYVARYSGTMHVDPVQSEYQLEAEHGVINVITHEAQHIGDFKNHPFFSTIELVRGGLEYARHVAATAKDPSMTATLHPHDFCPLERRAYARAEQPDVAEHQQDILFPNSTRTLRLIEERQLSLLTLGQLGLDQYEKLASDYKKPKGWFRRLLSSDN